MIVDNMLYKHLYIMVELVAKTDATIPQISRGYCQDMYKHIRALSELMNPLNKRNIEYTGAVLVHCISLLQQILEHLPLFLVIHVPREQPLLNHCEYMYWIVQETHRILLKKLKQRLR